MRVEDEVVGVEGVKCNEGYLLGLWVEDVANVLDRLAEHWIMAALWLQLNQGVLVALSQVETNHLPVDVFKVASNLVALAEHIVVGKEAFERAVRLGLGSEFSRKHEMVVDVVLGRLFDYESWDLRQRHLDHVEHAELELVFVALEENEVVLELEQRDFKQAWVSSLVNYYLLDQLPVIKVVELQDFHE